MPISPDIFRKPNDCDDAKSSLPRKIFIKYLINWLMDPKSWKFS